MRAIALATLFLAATPAFAEEIKCDGPFAADSSEARLVESFGKDNVVTGDVPGPEGSTVLATTLFPNDASRTMEFGWWDEEKLERTAYFTVPAADTTPGGLKVGMTVKEVEVLNGGPFQLYGFFWDYGGSAGFEGGKLGDLPGGCIVSVRFGVGEYPADLNVDAISGDQQITSTEPLLAQVDARIESITIGYPDFSATED
jgi:hypothetical protein